MNAFITVSCYAVASSALLFCVLLSAGEVEGLTAFGKSNSADRDNRTQPGTPKAPKGKLCNSQTDCIGIGTTSCDFDKTNGKKYCLCKDGSVPINGKCAVVLSAPGRQCSLDSECIRNAECAMNNETHKRTCTCIDGYSYDSNEDDSMCSGAVTSVFPSVVAMLLVAFTVLIIAPRTADEQV